MDHRIFKLRIGEIIFFTAGLLMLVSLPFLEKEGGFFIWVLAKAVYFIGLALFFVNFVFKRD